ncbi:hypothetical protein K2X05_00990 [bacterium]|nr:hypothetical protein [bacterium]
MKGLLIALAMVFSLNTFAAAQFEIWEGKEVVFVARDEQGRFTDTQATLSIESWDNSSETSVWVARASNGRFLARYTGKLEKFSVGSGNEQSRIVMRDNNGQFITWIAVDELLTAGWENWKNEGWVYVIRYNGKFINWAKGNEEYWTGYGEVLVVRDSNDGSNNGKILTWMLPDAAGNYHDPVTGQFLTQN